MRRKIYYVLNVLQLKSNHKSLNAIYFWGQEVNDHENEPTISQTTAPKVLKSMSCQV